MKNIFFSILWIFFWIQNSFADGAWWITWLSWEKLRNWDVHTDDIPNMMVSIINFGIYIAWSVAIIFIIVWAYKILLGSIQQDKTKWKDTIIMAIWGFIIATLAWFIINFIMTNF